MLRNILHLSLWCVLASNVQSSDVLNEDNIQHHYTSGLTYGDLNWIETSLVDIVPTYTRQGQAINQTERFENIEGVSTKYIDLYYPYNPMDPTGTTRATIQIGATAKGAYYSVDIYSMRNGPDKPELSEDKIKASKGAVIPGQIKQSAVISHSTSNKSRTKFGFRS